MTAPVVPPLDRCQITTRFIIDEAPVVVECISEAGHPGDCTMIDPNTSRNIRVGRSASKW